MDGRRLVIDNRYDDLSGIGRYAREVVPRLQSTWTALDSQADPMDKKDVLNPARLRLRRRDTLYSPGFAVGPSRALQIPTLHDLLHVTHPRDDSGRLHRLYYERVVKPVVRRGKHVITVSATSARSIAGWLADDDVTVHDCGNGCSDAFTVAGPPYPSAQPYFLFVGNMKPHKRPELAVEILRAVPDADLRMVVRDADAARALAESAGVADRVHVHSQLTDAELAGLYRGSSGLLFTSEWEGFGLPVVESLRCGTPVICDAACDSAAELAAHDPSSVVLPAAAPTSDWAVAAMALLESRTRSAASSDWLDSHSWSAVAARIDAVLAEVT